MREKRFGMRRWYEFGDGRQRDQDLFRASVLERLPARLSREEEHVPYYYGLKEFEAAERARTIGGIRALREGLRRSGVPARNLTSTALLATWNIREFDSPKFGERSSESFYYIAE